MTPSQRAKSNRERGVRFERRIARMLREAGYDARRRLEYDGFTHGWDIELRDPRDPEMVLPIVIQCKATANPRDLHRGLEEAMTHNPDGWMWACLHTHKRHLRIKVYIAEDFNSQIMAWPEFIQLLTTFTAPPVGDCLTLDTSTPSLTGATVSEATAEPATPSK